MPHCSGDMPKGTVQAILKQAGLSRKDFLRTEGLHAAPSSGPPARDLDRQHHAALGAQTLEAFCELEEQFREVRDSMED